MNKISQIWQKFRHNVSKGDGFSLIELLVALAIFSMAALALLEAQGQSLNTASQLEMRALASMVAGNREALFSSSIIVPPPGGNSGYEEQMNAKFLWRESRIIIPNSKLMRMTVTVSDEKSVELARLDAFRRLP
jgi:general secretion pathway protein I